MVTRKVEKRKGSCAKTKGICENQSVDTKVREYISEPRGYSGRMDEWKSTSAHDKKRMPRRPNRPKTREREVGRERSMEVR